MEGVRVGVAGNIIRSPMSQLGQSRHSDGAPLTSGLPRQTDILTVRRHVSKVPKAVRRWPANSHVENVKWQAC